MFSPYHKFIECSKFTERVRILNETIHPNPDLIEDTYRYYDALLHKLKSANKNMEEFCSLINNASPTNIDKAFLFSANLYADGFFYNCGSALDILARLILLIYGDPLTSNIYFPSAKAKLLLSHPTNVIIGKLEIPSWKDKFSDYRNSLTHEIMIADKINITMQFSYGTGDAHKISIPFPDDPRLRPSLRTYNEIGDGQAYLKLIFKRILTFMNVIFKEINQQLSITTIYPL